MLCDAVRRCLIFNLAGWFRFVTKYKNKIELCTHIKSNIADTFSPVEASLVMIEVSLIGTHRMTTKKDRASILAICRIIQIVLLHNIISIIILV